MTTPDRDPLTVLPQIEVPEPDPVVMNATIAQSREAFIEHQARRSRRPKKAPGWRLQWLLPAGVGAMALAVALVVAPGLIQAPLYDDAPTQVADAPTPPMPSPEAPPTLSRGDAPVTAEDAAPSGGVSMGIRPGQPAQQVDPLSLPLTEFPADGVRLSYRQTPSELLLYLPEISTERPIDSQMVLQGEDVDILAAFALADEDVVAVQLRVDDTQFWRVYRPDDGIYARDSELSALVSDAPDQAEVERRLSAL